MHSTFTLFSPPKTLVINSTMAAYINRQAVLDKAYQVVIVADTILVAEDVRLTDIDILFICNVFKGSATMTITPTQFDIGKQGEQGRVNGHRVTIVTKSLDGGHFILPGQRGQDGDRGTHGNPGDSARIAKSVKMNDKASSPGSPGSDGKPGLKGGHGGHLELFFISEKQRPTLEAPLAEGGTGGRPGRGGMGYFSEATAATRNLDRDRQRMEFVPRRANSGLPGPNGAKGGDGKIKPVPLDEQQFAGKIKDYTFFNFEEVSSKGWHMIFQARQQ